MHFWWKTLHIHSRRRQQTNWTVCKLASCSVPARFLLNSCSLQAVFKLTSSSSTSCLTISKKSYAQAGKKLDTSSSSRSKPGVETRLNPFLEHIFLGLTFTISKKCRPKKCAAPGHMPLPAPPPSRRLWKREYSIFFMHPRPFSFHHEMVHQWYHASDWPMHKIMMKAWVSLRIVNFSLVVLAYLLTFDVCHPHRRAKRAAIFFFWSLKLWKSEIWSTFIKTRKMKT